MASIQRRTTVMIQRNSGRVEATFLFSFSFRTSPTRRSSMEELVSWLSGALSPVDYKNYIRAEGDFHEGTYS